MHVGEANKLGALDVAALAVVVIALIGAVASYFDDFLATTVASASVSTCGICSIITCSGCRSVLRQAPDGRHDRALTSDIDSVESFIASAMLGILFDALTIVGMIVVMFYLTRASR